MHIYIYTHNDNNNNDHGRRGGDDRGALHRAGGDLLHFLFFLTHRVFPISSWCFCSGGGQVILQRR